MTDRKFGLGVLVCVFNRDFSKILLLKRNQEKRNKSKDKAEWGNVGGHVELGEKVIDACIREASEEIGVDLNPERLKFIEIKETPYLTDIFHAIHFVYATTLDENEKITINEESDEHRWFDLNDLPDKTLDSKEEITKLNLLARQAFLGNER